MRKRGVLQTIGALFAVFIFSACVGTGASKSPGPASAPATTSATPGADATAMVSRGPNRWTGIHWTRMQSIGLAALPTEEPFDPLATDPPEDRITTSVSREIHGWSQGYVAFTYSETDRGEEPIANEMTASVSADGVHWTTGSKLDVEGMKGLTIWALVEGPAGLLAAGTQQVNRCGPVALHLWLSSDGGRSWRRLATPEFYRIAGGESGYIAWDDRSQVWTSENALSWAHTDMNKAAVPGIQVEEAVSFAGGFVVAAAVPVPDSEVCGAWDMKIGSFWWSKDGESWSRDELVAPVGQHVYAGVRLLTDHVLLGSAGAYNDAGDVTAEKSWISRDGIRWTAFADPFAGAYSSAGFSYGDHSVIAKQGKEDGPVVFSILDDEMQLFDLTQSGDMPGSKLDVSGLVFGGGTFLLQDEGDGLWIGTLTRA